MYIGEWEASKVLAVDDGEVTEMDAADIYQNFTLVLMSGGRVTLNLDGEDSEGTWKVVDNGIEIDGEMILTKRAAV